MSPDSATAAPAEPSPGARAPLQTRAERGESVNVRDPESSGGDGRHDATPGPGRGAPTWVKGVLPLAIVVALVIGFFRLGPVGVFRGAFPPVEELTVDRITLPAPGELRIHVVNGGPEPVTVAQVLVDDASWVHTIENEDRTIGRLGSRWITIPYPWVEGEPHVVKLISSTGVTFEGEIAVAAQTPTVDVRYVSTFALLGLYAGVIPVFIGLLWFPFLRSIRRQWLEFFLSLTIGLLLFLGVDALLEASETAAHIPGAFQGSAVILIGVIGTWLLLSAIGRRRTHLHRERTPLYVATLIAIGIGLHNLGEGLAIGASYASGEIALGSFLVVGFLLHNTTEGLGILAPLAKQRPTIGQLVMLGAIAGVPTIPGAWLGGFSYSPLLTTLFLAIGVGAIGQVVVELLRLVAKDRSTAGFGSPVQVAGLLAGLGIMYATGLLVSV